MEHNTQQSKHSTSRRSFLRKGLAVGGAGAIGAGLLANGLSLPAFAEESSSSLTKGDVAILRLLAAVEIIESDLWQQYNELGGIQGSEVQGGSGSAPYVAGLLVLDGVYWLLSISVPKSNIEDGCISSFSSPAIHRIDDDTFLHNDFFPDSGTES